MPNTNERDALTALHGQVMNIQADHEKSTLEYRDRREAYIHGHRDARHTAAELVAATAPNAGAMPAADITPEIEQLRAEQAASVMPLIGPLLDAWEGLDNDTKAILREEANGIHKYIGAICHAMLDAPHGAQATSGEIAEVAVCCGRRECGGECGNTWEGTQASPKHLDDPRLQQLFGDAIEGALALGYQNSSPPPDGHWLARFWDIGRAEAAPNAGAPLADTCQSCNGAGGTMTGGLCAECYGQGSYSGARDFVADATPLTDKHLKDSEDWVVRETKGAGMHVASVRAIERHYRAAAPAQQAGAPLPVTDAMVAAYLKANDEYWRRTDELPGRADRWRKGTPTEATRESLTAALAVAGAPLPLAPSGTNATPFAWECKLLDENGDVQKVELCTGSPMVGDHGIEGWHWVHEPLYKPGTVQVIRKVQDARDMNHHGDYYLMSDGCVTAGATPPQATLPASEAVDKRLQHAKTNADVAAQFLMDAHAKRPETWLGYYDDALVHIDTVRKDLDAMLLTATRTQPQADAAEPVADPFREHLARQAEGINVEQLAAALTWMGSAPAGEGQEGFVARLAENVNRLTRAVASHKRATEAQAPGARGGS